MFHQNFENSWMAFSYSNKYNRILDKSYLNYVSKDKKFHMHIIYYIIIVILFYMFLIKESKS